MATEATKKGAGLLGLGAAACAACCAGPILGVLAAAGLLTVAAYLAIGLIGLAVAIPLAAWAYRRRKAQIRCTPSTSPVLVKVGPRRDPPS